MGAVNEFWEIYAPEWYSLWWMEYQNLPKEGKVLFRCSNSKGMFLQKLDNFRKYAFAVHGVYGTEGDYNKLEVFGCREERRFLMKWKNMIISIIWLLES